MKQKLVAFDADGTIIDYNIGGVVAESTKNAITELKIAGHIPAIITGRSFNMTQKLAADLGIEYIGVLNGAQIFKGNKLIYSKSLGYEISKKLVKRTENMDVGILAFDNYLIQYRNISEDWKKFIYDSINSRHNIVPIGEEPYDFASFYIYGDKENLEKAVYGIENIEFHNNRHEITKEGVDKGVALKILADRLGIEIEDTIAFGDGVNDIPMLKAAGTGVAIKTGNVLAREAADTITENGRDAIAGFLRKIGMIGE